MKTSSVWCILCGSHAAIGVLRARWPIFLSMNAAAKQTVFRHFTYGLYALTVKREGDEHGVTANWVSQASFDPPMVVVAVESTAKMIEMIRDARHFAISVFHEGQRELADKLGRGSAGACPEIKGSKIMPGATSRVPVPAPALRVVAVCGVATT